MIVFGFLVAGFAGGWIVRSSVDSSRAAAVAGVSAFYSAVERGRRLLAIEREHLEDLVAEGRARYETARLRAVRANHGAERAEMPAPRGERLHAATPKQDDDHANSANHTTRAA
jgi:hypothetical protein